MIASFKDKATQTLFETGEHRRLGEAARSTLRKLRIPHATTRLDSLRIPRATGWRPCAATGPANIASA